MHFKRPHDLPRILGLAASSSPSTTASSRALQAPARPARILGPSGILVPKYDGVVEGWYCLLGDVPNYTKIRDALQRLVDALYFCASVHFTFIDTEITKGVAMDIIDAVRNRKDLMDEDDLSGLT